MKWVTQSDLMHVHRQILQSTNAERLAKAPQASHAFENDSYVLLETIDGPKDSLHTRRLGSYKILSSNKNNYRLRDLISKREFSTNITRLVLFHFDPSRVNPQEVDAKDSVEFLIERILDHQGSLRGRSKKDVLFKVRWLSMSDVVLLIGTGESSVASSKESDIPRSKSTALIAYLQDLF